jgi:hypothetical protein
MAQHDYVIANGTGAAVRSDLNNGLAAIVSNNSGATEPATMYAYQWWADTTTGLLKIRNAANNGWVTVGTLASANLGLLSSGSTIAAALGSASTPSITFTGDTNTGIYSPGADQVAVATGGTGRLFVDSSGRLGLGTGSPAAGIHIATAGQTTSALDTAGNINLLVTDTGASAGNGGSVVFGFNSGAGRFASIKGQVITGAGNSTGHLTFSTRNATSDAALTERLRITNDGLVGIGTTTATANGGVLELSGGITFPATAVAASNANTLDDYEEGTWTPTLNGGTTTTYLYQNGYYVRIGRLVHVTARFAITSIGNGSDRVITGLPFAIGSPSSGSWTVDYWDSINSSVYSIAIVVGGSSSSINIAGQTAATSTSGNISIFKNGARVDFGGTYQVY